MKSNTLVYTRFGFVLYVNSMLDVDKFSYTTSKKPLQKNVEYTLLTCDYGPRRKYFRASHRWTSNEEIWVLCWNITRIRSSSFITSKSHPQDLATSPHFSIGVFQFFQWLSLTNAIINLNDIWTPFESTFALPITEPVEEKSGILVEM